MKKKLIVPAGIVMVGFVALVASLAAAETADSKPGQQELKLPHGWTEEDMKAAMEAGTPGKMHEHLAKSVGQWHGKNTMWMVPGAEPTTSDCTATVTSLMDGRYTKCEWAGEMPGMGPYQGFGIYGYDNVAQKFVCLWIDNHSTGFMNGEGEMSSDGKTITWDFTFNCPITRKPMAMREVETITGPNTKTLEMTGTDPKSGEKFKMMRVELTKKEDAQRGG